VGELFIAGPGVSPGYLGRAALTAEKLLPDPWAEEPGARRYRTGDLVRFRGDGELEYLGRADRQVKIRGFRIELEEIEAILAQHPDVREAVVAVREDRPGDLLLAAYVVPREAPEPGAGGVEPGALRAFLSGRLPDYMVPSAWAVLPALPLTRSGKIDRAALPAPLRQGATGRIAPRDTLEHALARLWEEALGVGPIGIRDDFFSLGGHSLLAVRLMSRIETQLGQALPLSALFTAGTVEGMAALLRGASSSGPASNLIPLQPRGTRLPFFWVHPAGGDVLCYAALARQLGDDQPVYGIQARGFSIRNDGRDEEPPASLEEMAALYIDEIRHLQPEGPYLLGGWSLGGPVAFEMARQLQAQEETVALLAIVDGMPGVAGSEQTDAGYLMDIAAYIGNFWGRDPGIDPGHLATLGPDEQIAHVAERLAAADFLPPGTGEAQLRRVLAVYRANDRALQSYRPGPYPDGLTLFRAEERLVPPDEAEDLGSLGEEDLGWRRVVSGPVEIHTVPGNHLSLMAEPHVRTLAERLRGCLERALAGEVKNFA
jgi:thioesterase domain-containing protein